MKKNNSIYTNSLIYGTWSGVWGRRERPVRNNSDICLKLLKTAISKKISGIDTSEMYGDGFAEEMIGKLSAKEKNKLKIISKVKGTNLSYNSILKANEGSLRRMKVDYIDEYLIHWLNPNIELKESLEAMLKLKSDGKIKKIGLANFNLSQIELAHSIIQNELFSVHLEYNYVKRNSGKIQQVEKEIIPYCKKNKISFYAFNPMDGVINSNIPFLNELSKKYSVTIPQLALNWILSKDVNVILGTSRVNHLIENLNLNFIIDEFNKK